MKISNPQRAVRVLFAVLIVAVGGLRVWIGRYSLCPDGISYLDLGDAFAGHHWLEAINAYWSPLYPWILGLALHPFLLSPKWELPSVQFVNLGIYLFTLCCFDLFLRSVLKSIQPDREPKGNDNIPLPEWTLLALGYSVFLWATLDLTSVWAVSPDLLIAGMVYLIAALLIHIRMGALLSKFALLGFVLGISYWSKAVMFPLGLTYLALAWFAVPRGQNRLIKIGIVGLVFLIVSAPLILGLSYKEGRVTFGDSGWLNYATMVSPGGRVRNWQGEPPESGLPLHPTRQVYQHPPVFEFATPIGGTYPPTNDPAYWNAGRRWTFNFRAQAFVVLRHLLMYLELFLNSQPGLVTGVLTLVALGGKATRAGILRNWFLFAICLSALGIYMLVHAETRFLGAQVAIAWIAILSAIRLDKKLFPDKLVITLMGAVAITILVSVFASTARFWRDGEPCSAAAHVEVAEDLESVGMHRGSRVAVFGDGDWAYWARLAHLRIVAEIMSPDTPAFWASTEEEKARIYQALMNAGAMAVVTNPPLPPVTLDGGWSRLGNSPYYIRWLKKTVEQSYSQRNE